MSHKLKGSIISNWIRITEMVRINGEYICFLKLYLLELQVISTTVNIEVWAIFEHETPNNVIIKRSVSIL